MNEKELCRSQIDYLSTPKQLERQSDVWGRGSTCGVVAESEVQRAKPQVIPLRLRRINLQSSIFNIKRLSAGLFIPLLLALASSALAEPTVTISYDYYEIEGWTADDLRQQMDRHGIRWTDGNTFDAYTAWNVNWHYRYRIIDGECSMIKVTTTVKVVFRLPRWTDYENAPVDLQKKWDIYMQALKHHEDGHKDFGIKAAAEIERALAELEPAESCEELTETANDRGQQIISKYAEAEKDYDAETNFGKTQGAVFP